MENSLDMPVVLNIPMYGSVDGALGGGGGAEEVE